MSAIELVRSRAERGELSGEHVASTAELSPHPERAMINGPKRGGESSGRTQAISNAGTALPAQECMMRPNLDLENDRNENASRRDDHVMSWMSYD